MIESFKKHFIPHEGNNHRPLFLHTKNTRKILLAILAFELIVYILPTFTFVRWIEDTNIASVLPGVLSALTNDERQDNNLNELVVSPLLTEAAQQKANDMADKGYFAHTSPEGRTPWYWLDSVGYEYEYAGENLAINFSDSKDVTRAWMKSPTHRANIIKTNYTEVGTGVATGMYEGERTIFVAQVYANPKKKLAPVTTSTASIPVTAPASAAVPKPTQIAVNTVTEVVTAPDVATEVLGTTSPRKDGTDNGILSPGNSDGDNISKTEIKISDVQFSQPENLAYEILTSPRHITNFAFYAMLAVVLLALILKVFIRFDVQYPDLVTNGLRVATVIIAIVIINNFITERTLEISQGYDYSKAQVVSAPLELN